jgi:Tfp pilus assembly protein PilO
MMGSLKQRELWLIAILLVAVIVTSFSLIKIQPLRNQLVTLKKAKQKVQKKFNKAKTATKKKGSVKKMQASLKQLKEKIETEGKTMAGYQQSFIDLQQDGMQADLKAEITHLIESQGMTILDIGEDSQSLDKLVNAQTETSTNDISRPMINLKLTGDFSMLNDFIQQLETLPNSVVITRLSMTVERQEDMRAPYQLMTELSLAL